MHVRQTNMHMVWCGVVWCVVWCGAELEVMIKRDRRGGHSYCVKRRASEVSIVDDWASASRPPGKARVVQRFKETSHRFLPGFSRARGRGRFPPGKSALHRLPLSPRSRGAFSPRTVQLKMVTNRSRVRPLPGRGDHNFVLFI